MILTVVDCQNLSTVHLDKAAQWKLGVIDPQFLCPVKGDPLKIYGTVSSSNDEAGYKHVCQLAAFPQTDLMMVVVNQASDYVGLFFIQLLQDIGRV